MNIESIEDIIKLIKIISKEYTPSLELNKYDLKILKRWNGNPKNIHFISLKNCFVIRFKTGEDKNISVVLR